MDIDYGIIQVSVGFLLLFIIYLLIGHSNKNLRNVIDLWNGIVSLKLVVTDILKLYTKFVAMWR